MIKVIEQTAYFAVLTENSDYCSKSADCSQLLIGLTVCYLSVSIVNNYQSFWVDWKLAQFGDDYFCSINSIRSPPVPLTKVARLD